MDVYYDGRSGDRPGPLSIVRDATLGVDYIVYRQLNNCTLLPQSYSEDILTHYYSTFYGNSTRVVDIGSPPQIIFFIPFFAPFSYEGVSTIRGVDVDSWIGYVETIGYEFTLPHLAGYSEGQNVSFELFFTRPGWRITSDRAVSSEPQFWRLVVDGYTEFTNYTDNVSTLSTISAVFDIFDYSTEEPDFDFFDITPCLPPSEYRVLSLAVPGHERGLDFSQLRRNLRSAFVSYSSVQPLQVGNIQVSS